MPGRMLTCSKERMGSGSNPASLLSSLMFHPQNSTTMKRILFALYESLVTPEYNIYSMKGKFIKGLEHILGIEWEDVEL